MTQGGAEMKGYLTKEGQGKVGSFWRKRWFVLRHDSIVFYKSSEDTEPLGSIQLEDISEAVAVEIPGQSFCFKLKGSEELHAWVMGASSEDERSEWMAKIRKAVQSSDAQHKAISISYASVECFATVGVRVSGNVGLPVLAALSNGVKAEKKRRDENGWFCEVHVPICTALNLFIAYGWTVESMYEAVGCLPGEKDFVPCVSAIFSKRYGDEDEEDSAPTPAAVAAAASAPASVTSGRHGSTGGLSAIVGNSSGSGSSVGTNMTISVSPLASSGSPLSTASSPILVSSLANGSIGGGGAGMNLHAVSNGGSNGGSSSTGSLSVPSTANGHHARAAGSFSGMMPPSPSINTSALSTAAASHASTPTIVLPSGDSPKSAAPQLLSPKPSLPSDLGPKRMASSASISGALPRKAESLNLNTGTAPAGGRPPSLRPVKGLPLVPGAVSPAESRTPLVPASSSSSSSSSPQSSSSLSSSSSSVSSASSLASPLPSPHPSQATILSISPTSSSSTSSPSTSRAASASYHQPDMQTSPSSSSSSSASQLTSPVVSPPPKRSLHAPPNVPPISTKPTSASAVHSPAGASASAGVSAGAGLLSAGPPAIPPISTKPTSASAIASAGAGPPSAGPPLPLSAKPASKVSKQRGPLVDDAQLSTIMRNIGLNVDEKE